MYNFITVYSTPPGLKNESEASSFYYFFPAIFFAACISRRIARDLGLDRLAAHRAHNRYAVISDGRLASKFLAKISLLSYIPSYRADLTIGLASIILCVYLLSIIVRARETDSNYLEASLPLRVGGFIASLFL